MKRSIGAKRISKVPFTPLDISEALLAAAREEGTHTPTECEGGGHGQPEENNINHGGIDSNKKCCEVCSRIFVGPAKRNYKDIGEE